MIKVDILLLTKNSKTLSMCLEEIKKTTGSHELYRLFIINGGEALRIDLDDDRYPVVNKVVKLSVGPLIAHINRGIYEADDYLVVFNDACCPKEKWLEYALEDYEKAFPDGDGVLALNDGKCNGSKACIVMTRKHIIDKYLGGFLYSPDYHHYFGDDDLHLRATRAGIFAYSDRSKINIEWHQFNPIEHNKYWAHDMAVWNSIR